MPHNLLEPTVRSISTGSGAGLGSGSMPTSRERYYEYHSTVIFTGQQLTNWPSESSHCTMGKHFTNLEVRHLLLLSVEAFNYECIYAQYMYVGFSGSHSFAVSAGGV